MYVARYLLMKAEVGPDFCSLKLRLCPTDKRLGTLLARYLLTIPVYDMYVKVDSGSYLRLTYILLCITRT